MKDIAPVAPDCRVASLLLAVAAAMGDSTADVPPQETIYVNNLNEKLNKDLGSAGHARARTSVLVSHLRSRCRVVPCVAEWRCGGPARGEVEAEWWRSGEWGLGSEQTQPNALKNLHKVSICTHKYTQLHIKYIYVMHYFS